MKRKAVAFLLMLTLVISSLAGCGTSGDSESKTSEATEGETTASAATENTGEQQELNIAIFQGGYGDAYWNAVVELFEETHEGVTVNMTISPTIADIIRPQIVAGNPPDFIALNDTQEDGLILSLIKDRALLDITDVFEGENYAGTGTLKDDIIDGLLESTKCAPYGDGVIYLAPFNTGPQGLIYNKTAFTGNSWELPVTWDDFFALGDQIKEEDGRSLFTYQGIYPGYLEEILWPAIASAGGMEAINAICTYEEGSFNNEVVLPVLEQIQKIAADGYLLPGTVGMNHTEAQSEMLLGNAAFITNGTWMVNEMADAPTEEGFEYAMTPVPVLDEGDTRYILDAMEQFSIPLDAKNPELAKEFLRFLYSDESVALFAQHASAVFATKTARDIAKEYITEAIYNMYGIYEADNTASLLMNFEALPSNSKINVSDEVFNPITSVMNGDMTVEEWAQSVEDAFAQIRADREAE